MSILKIFKRKETREALQIGAIFNSTSDIITGNDATSFAAMDLICSAFANLTGSFFNSITKEAIKDYYLYDLINYPNLDDTKFCFFYNSIKDYFSGGNVYWYKYNNNEKETTALFRLNPNEVKVKRNSFNQKIFIHKGKEYTSEKILHIPSRYGYNGLVGKSIFSECSNIFKNISELDAFVNTAFNNNVGNRLIINIEKAFPNASEKQLEELKNTFIKNYSGLQNAGKPLIQSNKIEYSKIETDYKSNQANQLIENRTFNEKEVAKLFGVPLALLTGGEKDKDIESLYILFCESALRPIATQFEQSINKLIPAYDRNKIYFEYSYNSLLKTSLQTRVDTYAKQLTNGILTPNEIRRKENLSEVEAGDNLFIGANLMPLRTDIIEAYMAGAKLKLAELNTESPNTNGDHSNLGDDKI